jgi:hypothetical protein
MSQAIKKILTDKSARDAKALKAEMLKSANAFQPWGSVE